MTLFAPQIARLGEISDRYDAILCDIWGVLHNGVASFVEASTSLAAFRRRGGAVVLITNAPRPSAVIGGQLLKLGVFPEAFDAVVTSGDVTIRLIEARIGDPLFHLGPARDLSLFEAAEAATGRRPALVPLAEARYCVCTGLRDDRTETPEDYEDELRALGERSLPMVCANPDIVIHRGDTPVYCAGALARRYEEIGGEVVYAGKPYLPIYDRAIAEAERARGARIDRRRILADRRRDEDRHRRGGGGRDRRPVHHRGHSSRRAAWASARCVSRPERAPSPFRRIFALADRRDVRVAAIKADLMQKTPFQTYYFDELAVGMRETISKTVENEDVIGFAELSGDHNPIHLSEHFARKTRFGSRIVHGLYTASLISGVIGMRLPGPGAVYISQSLNFLGPVKIGDVIDVSVEVAELTEKGRRVRLKCECRVGDKVVLEGEGVLSVPPNPKLRHATA